MLHFDDHPTIHLHRPVTVASVAQALAVKPFELLGELIHMQVFLAPHQRIDDDSVHALGRRIRVTFLIEGNDDNDGSSTIPVRPIAPIPPSPLTAREPDPPIER